MHIWQRSGAAGTADFALSANLRCSPVRFAKPQQGHKIGVSQVMSLGGILDLTCRIQSCDHLSISQLKKLLPRDHLGKVLMTCSVKKTLTPSPTHTHHRGHEHLTKGYFQIYFPPIIIIIIIVTSIKPIELF